MKLIPSKRDLKYLKKEHFIIMIAVGFAFAWRWQVFANKLKAQKLSAKTADHKEYNQPVAR